MNDGEFLQALESCTLAESDFGHAAHIRAGYLYLKSLGFAAALAHQLRTRRVRCAVAFLPDVVASFRIGAPHFFAAAPGAARTRLRPSNLNELK